MPRTLEPDHGEEIAAAERQDSDPWPGEVVALLQDHDCAIAPRAEVQHLALSYLMPCSERTLERNLQIMRGRFQGPIEVADDLMCICASHRVLRDGGSSAAEGRNSP